MSGLKVLTYAIVLEVIEAAVHRIIEPEHWCQKAYARNKSDGAENVGSAHACKWCGTGALLEELDKRGFPREHGHVSYPNQIIYNFISRGIYRLKIEATEPPWKDVTIENLIGVNDAHGKNSHAMTIKAMLAGFAVAAEEMAGHYPEAVLWTETDDSNPDGGAS